jgi:O-antigen/teichoic acid export membrane protein
MKAIPRPTWMGAARLVPRSSLARHFGWMFAGQGMGYLLRAVYFVLIARLLGVLQYGVIVGAIALVNMVVNYGRLGSSIVFLRHVSADRSQFAVYWGNILLVTLSMSTLLIVALHFAAGHLIAPASAVVIVPTAIASCLFEQLTVGAGQVFQTFEKMGITATLNLLTSLARTLTAAGMLLVLHHATAGQWVIASMVVSGIAAIAAVVMVTIDFGWPKIEPRLFLKRGAEGAEYALSASTGCAYNDLDKAMLSHFGMSAANGIYTMAYRAIDLATMPASSMEAAAEPRMFQLGATSLQQAANFGRRVLNRSVLISAVVAVGMFVLAPLIPLLVGRGFAESVSALRWLCLIPVFRSIHGATGTVLTGAGLQRYRSVTQIIAAAGNFGLNLWLIPAHGWLGAAWASLITDGGLGVMNSLVLSFLCRSAARVNLGEPALKHIS